MHFKGMAAALAVSLLGVSAACAADQALPQVDAIYMADDAATLNWYASAKIGVALPGTINMTATAGGLPDLNGDARFKAGIAGAVAVGKYLAPNFRAEAELAVANNAGDSFTGAFAGVAGQTTGTLTGSVTTVSVMAMGYYEISQFGDFVPYLSAGLGAANINSNLTYNDPGALGFAINGTITGSSTVFAGRVGAGFQYALSDNVELTADYTLLVGSRANLTFTGAGGVGNRNVNASVLGHVLAVGLKARF